MASLSVVVAARDAEATIADALDSLSRQTLRPDEVIVVDDASSDATGSIARSAGVRVVTTPGVGPGGARNKGVAMAHGALIAFCDADDLFTEDHLALGTNLLERSQADALAADAWYWVHGRVTDFSHFDVARPSDPIGLVDLTHGTPLLSTGVFRRDALEKVGGYDSSLIRLEDYDLWLRLCLAGARLAPASRPTMFYRRALTGLSVDPDAMYSSLELVLRKLQTQLAEYQHASLPIERQLAIGKGNWALIRGDVSEARRQWKVARDFGDRRAELMLARLALRVAPAVVRHLLARRLTAGGRPVPVQVARWWRSRGNQLPEVSRPDLQLAPAQEK